MKSINMTMGSSETPRRKRGRVRSLISYIPGVSGAAGLWLFLRDPQAPIRLRLSIVASIIYILSPIDLIPEMFLGPLGLVDDSAVAMGLIAFIFSKAMKPYRQQARARLRGEAGERKIESTDVTDEHRQK